MKCKKFIDVIKPCQSFRRSAPPSLLVTLAVHYPQPMSLTVAARHGAAALPVFSNSVRSNVRGFTAEVARHSSKSIRQSRGLTVKTRAEMEYDYDIFTIGTLFAHRVA